MQLDGYLNFLKDCFTEIDWEQEPRSRHWFNQAMETGVTFHGPQVRDDSLLVEAALAAEDLAKAKVYVAPFETLRPEAEKNLGNRPGWGTSYRREDEALETCTSPAASAYLRILLWHTAQAEERNDPELAGLVAQRLLEDTAILASGKLCSRGSVKRRKMPACSTFLLGSRCHRQTPVRSLLAGKSV